MLGTGKVSCLLYEACAVVKFMANGLVACGHDGSCILHKLRTLLVCRFVCCMFTKSILYLWLSSTPSGKKYSNSGTPMLTADSNMFTWESSSFFTHSSSTSMYQMTSHLRSQNVPDDHLTMLAGRQLTSLSDLLAWCSWAQIRWYKERCAFLSDEKVGRWKGRTEHKACNVMIVGCTYDFLDLGQHTVSQKWCILKLLNRITPRMDILGITLIHFHSPNKRSLQSEWGSYCLSIELRLSVRICRRGLGTSQSLLSTATLVWNESEFHLFGNKALGTRSTTN